MNKCKILGFARGHGPTASQNISTLQISMELIPQLLFKNKMNSYI